MPGRDGPPGRPQSLPSACLACFHQIGPNLDRGRPLAKRAALLVALAFGLAGCSAVPVYQQELVSSYGMVFSDSPVLMAEPALLTQMEPGVASTGGGQAAGCSSCR